MGGQRSGDRPPFALDPRLLRDCLVLGRFAASEVLLMNRAELPWFVLVPHTEQVELYRLTPAEQAAVMRDITALSRLIEAEFDVDKLNVAAIGNIVPQLHIHVVGRQRNDAWWPNVVWGSPPGARYQPARVRELTRLLEQHCGESFAGAP